MQRYQAVVEMAYEATGHSPYDLDLAREYQGLYEEMTGRSVPASDGTLAKLKASGISGIREAGASETAVRLAVEHSAAIGLESGVATGAGAAAAGSTAKGIAALGRAGKQERLQALAKDDKLGSADRGWLTQELNSIERGQRSTIRNPPGKDLAHERGREAAKGYDYSHSNLQDRDLHRLQHKYDDFGRANTERSPP